MTRDEALTKLKPLEAELRAQGLAGLYLFGSVARGEECAESDLDLACDIVEGYPMGYVEFAGIMLKLEDELKARVDLVPRRALRPHIRPAIERDMVRIF